jgi:hypothetical protein
MQEVIQPPPASDPLGGRALELELRAPIDERLQDLHRAGATCEMSPRRLAHQARAGSALLRFQPAWLQSGQEFL